MTGSGLPVAEWPRVQVHPGAGVVDRHGDTLLVVPSLAGPPEPVAELLGLGRRPVPGRDRLSALRALLDGPSSAQLPGFALLIRTGRALRIVVHGPVQVRVDGRPARQVDHLLEDGAWHDLAIAADGDAAAPDLTGLLPLDLEAGLVPGSAVTLHPAAATSEPAATPSETALRPVVRFRSVLLGECAARTGARPAATRRAPLPLAGGNTATLTTAPEVLVEGVRCPQGHLTDPGRPACLACGTPVRPGEHRVAGPRPPLGVLVTDGGTIYPVTGNFVIGRDPDRAAEVLAGRARPLQLRDAERSTSRVHASLSVDGWQVLLSDDGSANGTFVSGHGAAGPWVPVPPRTPVRLAHGDRVRFGRRQLLFDTWREGGSGSVAVPPAAR